MITLLQYRVLFGMLKNHQYFGRDIRAALGMKADASFYGLMKRMEDAHLIKGEYNTEFKNDMPKRRRAYRITTVGLRAKEEFKSLFKEENHEKD